MFFINSSDKKINDKLFTGQSWFSIFYKYWHSINLTVELIPEAYLEPSWTSAIKLFCDFHRDQSHRNYIACKFKHIEYFSCKRSFSYKGRMKSSSNK